MEAAPVDLAILSDLFAPKPKIPKPQIVPKIKKLTLIPRRTVTKDDIRRMFIMRHGSENPADVNKIEKRICEISKRLHIPYSTVHYALQRYKRRGFLWEDLRKNNGKVWIANTKIKGAIKEYLLSHRVLT